MIELLISERNYAQKPTEAETRQMRFERHSLSMEELIGFICDGYAFTSLMVDNWRRKSNFIQTSLIVYDIDGADDTMEDCIDNISIKPSFAYTSASNGKDGKGYRYRLVYVLATPITSAKAYEKASKSLAERLNLKAVDRMSFYPYTLWYGSNNCEFICNNVTYSLSDLDIINETDDKPDNDIIDDFYSMSFIQFLDAHAADVRNIDRTDLSYLMDDVTPVIEYPEDYFEVYRNWQRINGQVVKWKDGEGRRRRLYLDALIRRRITPDLSFEELLYCVTYDFIHYYINNGNKITKKEIYKISKNAFKEEIDEKSDIGRPHSKSFVNPLFCEKYGLSKKQALGLWKNKKQFIGELYDPSLTDKENIEVMAQHGLAISLITLKRWKKENGIRKYSKSIS